MGKFLNEGLVKIAEPHEGTDFLNQSWHRPGLDAFDFGGVHACYHLFKD